MAEQMQDNPIYKFMKANDLTKLDEKAFLDKYSAPEKAKEIHSFMVSNKLTDLDDAKFYDKYLKKKVGGEGFSPTKSPSREYLSEGQELADKGFIKTEKLDPSQLVSQYRSPDISLTPKPKKNYYNEKLEKGLIFDKEGKLFAPSSEALTKAITLAEEIDLKKPTEKDLVEKSREMPVVPSPYVSSPTQSQLASPNFEKGKAFAEQGFLMQSEGTKAPKKQKISIEPSLLGGAPKVKVLEEGEDPSLLASLSSSALKGQIQGKVANILSAGKRPSLEELGEIAQLQTDLQLFPQSKAEKVYQEKGLKGLFTDSPGLGVQFVAETMASSLSSLFEASKRTVPTAVAMGAAAGAPFVGIGALVGAGAGLVAGQSAAGYNISTSQDILSSLSENGVDISNKESLINAFSDEAKMAKIRTTAAKYGVPILVFDALTAGLAGKLAAGAVGKSLGKKLLAGLGETGLQITGGSGGELAAQVASGKKVNWDDIIIEGIAEVPGGVTEVATGVVMERSKTSSNNKTLATQIATQGVQNGSEDAIINLNRDKANNVITPEQHQEGVIFVEKAAQVVDKIPETVTGESKVKSVELLVERNDIKEANQILLQQKQSTDEAYHAGIDEEIKANEERIKKIDAEVYNIAKNPSKEVNYLKPKVVEVEMPSAEQQANDIKDGKISTFTYNSESEVPDMFKDKVSSVSETNGKKEYRVSIPESLANYYLNQKAQSKITDFNLGKEQVKPTEVKVTEEVKPIEVKELTKRQLDNREKSRIDDVVDRVENGDIKGSSISVADKDLTEYFIDKGLDGREAYIVKDTIERLIKPLKNITDKIDPQEVKFFTENVEDINSAVEGLEDARTTMFLRNKNVVDNVNKEAQRLLDYYSDKNNLPENKLDNEKTFSATVDLLKKFLNGEINYLDLTKFGIEKKLKDYYKPKVKAEVKPTEVKVTEEVKPKEANTLTSNKFSLVLSSEEDSLFKEYIERVGPDLVDANDVVKLANKIANVDGSVKRKLNHFSEALMYQDALIDSKDNEWFGKINSSDIIDIIKNPKKEFANLDRLDDIGLLSNDTKKQIEKVKEVGVKLASLDDNSKKLLAEFHKRMLINKPISEQIDSLNRILDYVGSEIKVNTKTEKSKKSDNNQYIRLAEAISKEVTEEEVASAEKTEPKIQPKESVEPPKTPPPTQEPTEKKEPFKADEKSILKRLSESKNISEDVKNKFKENLKYKVSSQEEARAIAKELVKEYGAEDAVILAEAGKFEGDVNSFIFAEAIDNAVENELKATSQEDKIKYASEYADYAMRYDESARKQGRFISAIADFYKKSPLGVIMVEKARREEGFKAWFTNKEKSYKEVFEELTNDPEFKELLDEKVQSELKEERKKSRADKRQKIEDFFENAKLKGNYNYAIPIPPQVINGALEVMKKAVLAGESITNAVSMAVEHISKEVKDWDKEKFRKEYEEKLNGIEGNKKSPLSTKEKQDQLLDRLRKKLKGLNDDQKAEIIRRSFKQIIENGALEYDDFKEIIRQVLGYAELTKADEAKIKGLVAKTNEVGKVAKSIMEDGNRSAENLKKYQAVKKEAEKASTELGKMVFNKIDLTNSVLSKMQLRTLGLVSLIQNPIYNLMNQVFVRFPIGVQLTVLDQILYGGSKVSNKLFGTSVLYPENNIFASQKQFFTKGYQGGKLATEQFFTGLTNADYMEKDVKTSQIHPYTSAKDLWAWKFKGKPLTKKQVLDKLLQASIGIVAEITARGLNIGDKPQRFASEGAKAAVLAKYLGLKDVDFLYFMQFPKEESYRAFKKQGLSDAVAMQKAEEIEKSIIKEGQESTFQQDNIVVNIINAGIQKGGKPADVVKYFALPFFKTNSNVAWSLYNLAFPPVAFLQSGIYSARAISSKSKSDIQESKKWFAHGVTGIALFSVVGALVKAGIVNAENDDEITKKERVGEKSFEQQNSINITKLNAYLRGENPNDVKDGLNIDLKWFGVTGMVANMVAKRIKRMTNQEKENQASYMEELLANQSDAAKELIQNGVFSTSADILQSVQGGGNFGSAVAFNLINMGTNIVQSATFAQISRAQLPYYSQQKADSFYDELKNNFLTRSSKLREITGKYPPSQNNIWGERMDRKDNTLMKLFGMSTTNKDNFAQPIYEDYKRTGNTKFFPPSIKPEVNNKKINNEQLNKLEVFVGKKRRMLAAPYINDGAILDGFPKVYSKLSEDDKLDALNKIYKVAYDLGVDEFVSLYPEYYQSKKQTPEQKKESSQSTKAGVALKNLAKNSKK